MFSFRMYFKDVETEKKWAYCYRLHAGINTNMALESFNNFLKSNNYNIVYLAESIII